ncbi:MAG: FliH/SctL family protein [Desulfosalsimonas sp.]
MQQTEKNDQTPRQPPADIEAIRSEAYANGKADGRKEVEQELHSASSALAEGLEQISRMRSSLLEKSRDDMVRLVMAVARRVIDTEVKEKKDIIVKTVTRALEGAVEDDEYYVRVNPADIETVRANEPMFLAAMKGLRNIHFVEDENVSRGGCKAESRAGDVDATIESQIDEIYSHLSGSQEQQ